MLHDDRVYRQFVHPESGYSTLQMTDDGMIANLFEQASCAFTLALIDPKEMIEDGPQGTIPCPDAHCPVNPAPPLQFNGSIGYCAGPPPPPPKPPSAVCQKKLDAYCQNKTLSKQCYPTGTEPSYPGYSPLYARDSFGCSLEPAKPWPHGLPSGPCRGALTKPAWRCYSALALTPDKSAWSNKAEHPNAYCSSAGRGLQHILEHEC
eukprot:SAG31_NODE_2431_length_5707_cov_2.157810_9_plen_206_part_00